MDKLVCHTFNNLAFIDFLEKSFDDYTLNRYVRGYIPTVIAFLLEKPCKVVKLQVERIDWLELIIYVQSFDMEFGKKLAIFLLRYEVLPYTVDERLHF